MSLIIQVIENVQHKMKEGNATVFSAQAAMADHLGSAGIFPLVEEEIALLQQLEEKISMRLTPSGTYTAQQLAEVMTHPEEEK